VHIFVSVKHWKCYMFVGNNGTEISIYPVTKYLNILFVEKCGKVYAKVRLKISALQSI